MGRTDLHTVASLILLLGIIACICGIIILGLLCTIWLQEKHRVFNMPKQPMVLCDIHGAYPASAVLKLEVPAEGKNALAVEMCPQCYHERLKKAGGKIR